MKKQLLKYAAIVTALFFLTTGLEAQNATLKGKVSSADGPLEIATVEAGSLITTTDANGDYSISLPAGDHLVKVSYAGYEAVSKRVSLKAGETVLLNFSLAALGKLDEVVLVGSRAKPRTSLGSPVPVDVIDVTRLVKLAPQVTVNQLLTFTAPSFTANTQSLGDGTDHIDPASLRGLGPDQVLILVNGKRRHTSSLVNTNGTFGKGTVGTDLNAIPVSSIEKIEILRDGAAAQYGSDAIAGVINIVLKKNASSFSATVNGGVYSTKSDGRKISDGEGLQLGINYGIPLGKKGGYLNLSGSYDSREATDRTGTYNGVIYRTYPGGADRTDSFLAATGTTRRDYNLKVGQSELKSGQFFYNAVIPVNEHTEFYSFGGLGYRKGLSAGFYRYPYQSRNVIGIYPRGFLPYIGSGIYDKSVSAGIRSQVNGWDVDFSNTYGQNQFEFSVENSLNASLLNASPTSFRAGGPRFIQNTVNTDISRGFDWLSGVNLSFGAEYRYEKYQIIAGDPNSYTNYGTARQIGVDGSGNPILVKDPYGPVNTLFGPDGSARPGGAQVFPGFRPENAVNEARTAVSVYAGAELNFSSAFLADAAIRYENYSDFGSATNGKLALRYKVTPKISVRASASTGFRAPSLQQRYYANTNTVFTNGVANDVGVFPNNSRAARLVGIPALRPEKSRSVSAGITGTIGRFQVTLDGYFTRINDRVIFTDQFSGSIAPGSTPADQELYAILLQANATKAQFFANAINTETRGVDLVVSYSSKIGKGTLRADLAGTVSQTQKVGAVKTSDLLAGKEGIYFSNANKVYLENAVPNTKASLGLTYTIRKFNVYLRNNYFGGVTEATSTLANQQHYNPRVVTDLSFGYTLTRNLSLTIGANNLLDVYPEKIAIAANSNSGQFIYSRSATQFGYNGRYLFGKISFSL